MNEQSNGKELTDQELDKLLTLASVPQIPADFPERMQRRVRATAAENVVAFPLPAKVAQPVAWRWPVVGALAASLVFGLWLGGRDPDPVLGDAQGDTAMLTSSDFSPAGMDDLDDIDVGQQS